MKMWTEFLLLFYLVVILALLSLVLQFHGLAPIVFDFDEYLPIPIPIYHMPVSNTAAAFEAIVFLN